jgi:hypothetical protein
MQFLIWWLLWLRMGRLGGPTVAGKLLNKERLWHLALCQKNSRFWHQNAMFLLSNSVADPDPVLF